MSIVTQTARVAYTLLFPVSCMYHNAALYDFMVIGILAQLNIS